MKTRYRLLKSGAVTALYFVAMVFATRAASAQSETRLTAGDGAAADRFGISVSLDGDRVVAGAEFDDDRGLNSGSAYVFERGGGTWVEAAKLTAADAAPGDGFGVSVSVDGDRVVVGAINDDDAGSASGSAYIFEMKGGTWTEVAKLTASDATANDRFGISVSLDGDRIAVGAYLDSDGALFKGSAYVFELQGDTWTEVAKLTAGDARAHDRFGVAVSLDGGRVVVGAYQDDDAGSDSGSAYVFELRNGTWTQTAKLTARGATAHDNLGISVSLDGDRVIAGASQNAKLGSGAAYVFELQDGTWMETARLAASDAGAGDRFGFSVAADRNRVVVGADLDDDRGANSGSAYVFELQNGTWTEIAKLTAADASGSDRFGVSVSLDTYRVVAGAVDQNSAQGSAYVFQLIEDGDGDGVVDGDDVCPDTVVPEAIPTVRLRPNSWALMGGDFNFDTANPKGGKPQRTYSITSTRGCSCEQIIARLDLGLGHTQYGCTSDAMDTWIALMAGASKRTADTKPAGIAEDVPLRPGLNGNYPNPFNAASTLSFEVAEAGVVRLVVFDVLGRPVKVLVEGLIAAGRHYAVLDASDLPSGLYVVQMETRQGRFTKTMLLQRL